MGCGGGTSGDQSTIASTDYTPVEPVFSENELDLYGTLTASTNDSVGFVILAQDDADITSVDWQQLSGPEVSILAAHTQAIGFDAVQAGDYEFSVNVSMASGIERSLTFILAVSESTELNKANIRLDHMATERGRVSLRVDSSSGKIITNASWVQTGGPEPASVTYQEDSTGGPMQSAFFDAPLVNEDSVMAFEVTLTFDDGSEATDNVFVGINDTPINNNGIFTQNDQYVTSDLIPYRSDSPYAEALLDCVYTNQLVDSCSFSELPLIGMQTSTPDIETILNKTLVSHPWMGDRFAEFLMASSTSEDMLKLLRGVTAIVISYDVRPSFYWVRTGAIYLDAKNFWRTPEERDTLNTAPDYRSGFGNDLQFGIYWRYVKDDSYYYPQASLAESSRNSRSIAQLEAALAWLMYHELAHANDFFPPSSWATISNSSNPLRYFQQYDAQSSFLYDEYPLSSVLLDNLADVSFGGATATTSQRAVTPSDAADEFSADTAPAYYAYYTVREDYATLFERFMMLYRLGVSADVAVIGTSNNSDALVTWGQRDRINLGALQGRTAYAVSRVLPDLNVASIQSELPDTTQMNAGVSWYNFAELTNVQRPSVSTIRSIEPAITPPLALPAFEQHLRLE